MKILHTFLLTLFFVAPAFGQKKMPAAASQAQVNAGTSKNTYVSPYTGSRATWAGGGGGNTNGITQAQYTAGLLTGTNNIKATNVTAKQVFSAGMTVTNATTNIFSTANTLLASGASKQTVSIPNALGALTNDGSGGFGWFDLSSFVGGGSTNLDSITISNGVNFGSPAGALGSIALSAGPGNAWWNWDFNSNNAATVPLHVNVQGDVYAAKFHGDGSLLTGLPSGASTTNFPHINVTNEAAIGSISPFAALTRHVFIGNSRTIGLGESFTNWAAYYYQNFVPASHRASYHNLAVSGRPVQTMSDNYTSEVHPLAPAQGTNAALYFCDSIVDVINSSNVTATINSMSNIFWNAKNDGFTLVASEAFECGGLTAAQLGILKQHNDYIETNQFCDYRVLNARVFSTYTLTLDTLHFNETGTIMQAGLTWQAVSDPKRISNRPTQEGHFGDFIDLYSSAFNVPVRGLNSAMRIAGDYPSTVYDSSSGGAAWLGMYNGQFQIWTGDGTGNITPLNGFRIGNTQGANFDCQAAFFGAVAIFNPSFYAPTNVAPFSTTSNPTNQFARSTLYTAPAYRTLLVGSTVGNGGSGTAQQTLLYTNNGVGYALPLLDLAASTKEIQTFSVPLSPGATFFFNTALGGSGTADLTNVVLWIQ